MVLPYTYLAALNCFYLSAFGLVIFDKREKRLRPDSLEKNIQDRWNNIKALCVVIGQTNAGANRITASTLDLCLLNY